MAATIKDIAKKVGVSPYTVSRVINGTASISEETKAKIRKAMQEMDYHPNSQARGLVNGSTFTIGLVLDAGNKNAFSNTFFINSVSAIEMIAQERGYNVLILNDYNHSNGNSVKNLVQEHKVDGIILPVQSMNHELVQLMEAHKLPFVVMGEPEQKEDPMFWVDIDNRGGCELAVEHLLNCGYSKPVLFVENKQKIFEKNRCRGFGESCKKRNISQDETYIIECRNDVVRIRDEIKRIVEGTLNADSVICTNNIVAHRVLKELKKGGKKIPEEIGVITFDNYPLAKYLEPALSAVDIDTYRMGEVAATMLFDQIQNKGQVPKGKLVTTKIILRESTRKGEKGRID